VKRSVSCAKLQGLFVEQVLQVPAVLWDHKELQEYQEMQGNQEFPVKWD